MATITVNEILATIQDVVQEVWAPTLYDLWPKQVLLFEKMRRGSDNFSPQAEKIYMKYETQGSHGYGVRTEAESLPESGSRAFGTMEAMLRYYYATLRVSGPSMKVPINVNNKFSFTNNVGHALSSLRNNIKGDLNRMMWGDGSARVGQAKGTGTFYPNMGTTGRTAFKVDNCNIQWFKHGCTYFFHTGTTEILCTFVDYKTDTIYFDGDVTGLIADNQWFYRRPSTYFNSPEPMGLAGHISEDSTYSLTGNYQGVDRTDPLNFFARANVIPVNGFISTMGLNSALDTATLFSQGELPTDVVTSVGVVNSYKELLAAKNQPIAAVPETTGWGAKLKFVFDGTELVLSSVRDAPKGLMYFLHLPSFYWLEVVKLGIMADGDARGAGKGFRRLQGYDVYEVNLENYFQICCHRPTYNSVLTGVIENGIGATL
jgi:hypothetical protein